MNVINAVGLITFRKIPIESRSVLIHFQFHNFPSNVIIFLIPSSLCAEFTLRDRCHNLIIREPIRTYGQITSWCSYFDTEKYNLWQSWYCHSIF